ncbi:TadE/TadG family type IV pilus assembly protein [Hyphomicrobium sp. 2TAF46]|uniref:TadE/TadG family type IV pilus assembly protein n=1 Tax=Hyphomicrobium sp. 2TAF46 TaxID=3233019 RepID=UPI003F905331
MLTKVRHRFLAEEKGSVAILFALCAMVVLFALGICVDYGMAAKRRAEINAIADAAALQAVTPVMMTKSSSEAQSAATTFFNSQIASVIGVRYQSDNVTVTVTDGTTSNSTTRSATVSYTASSLNAFSGILHQPTITIGATSTASAAMPPNIDFYLMLDTSPSMGIAATQTDINTMVAHTAPQGGCAFACHEYNPSVDKLGNPGGPNQDNYALARSLGVTLRVDLVKQATQNLMQTAQTTENTNGSVYRMAGYTFDATVKNPIPLTADLTMAQSEASNIAMQEVWSNNYVTKSNNNNDEDTNFDLAFSTLNSAMPAPGSGAKNDSPQEVLFIVTDGVSDESWSGNRTYAPFGGSSWCQTIKKRGIRIAVLYTTYNPLPTNNWYNTYISGEQPSIATTAQSCASPGLYFEVNTGGDISAAMNSLFQTAVSVAHLTQ